MAVADLLGTEATGLLEAVQADQTQADSDLPVREQLVRDLTGALLEEEVPTKPQVGEVVEQALQEPTPDSEESGVLEAMEFHLP